jgi:hypothetical protein
MELDYSKFLTLGKEIEERFRYNFNRFLITSSLEDQKGVDLTLNLTFDVKKARKIRRKDDNVSYDKMWIEYKNVYGKKGSICKKNLDFFIIESENSWLVKSRKDAYELFVEQAKGKELKYLDSKVEVELYQPYRRLGREDVIMLVEMNNPKWPTVMDIPKGLPS